MARPDSPPSATVTDLAQARRARERGRPINRRFDHEKVERLKRAIAEGRYEIDAARVADRFIEHERNG